MADKVSIVLMQVTEDRIRGPYFREGKKRRIPCGWHWQWDRF